MRIDDPERPTALGDEAGEARGPARLKLTKGGDAEFIFREGEVALGRSPEVESTIAHQGISRQHCKLIRDGGGGVKVVDLGSTNGTRVNGTRIESAFLCDGDELALGNAVAMTVHFDSSEHEDPIASLQRTLSLRESYLGPDDPEVAETLETLGAAFGARGEYANAAPHLERALHIREAAGSPPLELGRALRALGECRLELGDGSDAAEFLRRAVRSLRGAGSARDDLARASFALARAIADQDPARAVDLARAARHHYSSANRAATAKEVEEWLRAHEGGGL